VIEETGRRTERPFGVNFGLAWDQRERLASALAAGARIVSFFWGDAGDLIGEARAAEALVFVTAGTAEEGGPLLQRAQMSSLRKAGRQAGMSGAPFRRLRLCLELSTRSRRFQLSPQAGSPTGEVLLLCFRSERRARGWALAFLLRRRLGSIRTTSGGFWRLARPIRSTAPSSTAAGPTHHTARFATRPLRSGSGLANLRRDPGRAKTTSQLRGPTVRRSTDTRRRHRRQRRRATLSPYRTGRGRVSDSSVGRSPQPRSSIASWPRQTQSSDHWANSRHGG
jgi:hypothetical protein